jgi:hypothetical protein
MLLALYANGMLRLWNLLDARCINKRMVGLSGEYDSEDEDADEEEKQALLEEKQARLEKKNVQMDKLMNRPEFVRWEPSNGKIYAVLFGKLLEIFTVDSDEPLHSV